MDKIILSILGLITAAGGLAFTIKKCHDEWRQTSDEIALMKEESDRKTAELDQIRRELDALDPRDPEFFKKSDDLGRRLREAET